MGVADSNHEWCPFHRNCREDLICLICVYGFPNQASPQEPHVLSHDWILQLANLTLSTRWLLFYLNWGAREKLFLKSWLEKFQSICKVGILIAPLMLTPNQTCTWQGYRISVALPHPSAGRRTWVTSSLGMERLWYPWSLQLSLSFNIFWSLKLEA